MTPERLNAPVEGAEVADVTERLGYHYESRNCELVLQNPMGPEAADLIARLARERDELHAEYVTLESEGLRLEREWVARTEAAERERDEALSDNSTLRAALCQALEDN